MNIFTASMPGINPDQFMENMPASSTYDNVEYSRFSSMVNDTERSVARPYDNKDAFSKKEDMHPSKSGTVKNHDEAKTGETENRTDDRQETGDDNTDQYSSEDDMHRDGSGSDGKHSDQAGNDVKAEKAEESDNTENKTGSDNPQTAEEVTAAEVSMPNQVGEQVALNIIGQANSSKSQNNNINGNTHINNEGGRTVNNLVMDDVMSGELNAEDGEPDDGGVDNKTFSKNTGFGKSDLEEMSEDIDLDRDLKKKIRLAATRELPDKYVKKTVTDQSDNKTIHSQMYAASPEVLEELHNFKPLQENPFFTNMKNFTHNVGMRNSFSKFPETSVNSFDTFNSNTPFHNTELMQSQGLTMSGGKAGVGLMQGNAARTAGFSELLNHVVYVAKGKNKLGVTVNHEDFGKLKINVTMEKGMLNIHVNASEKVVREFLESNVQQIVENLLKDGVSVGGFSVAHKNHKDNPEKKFMMDSGLERQYEDKPAPEYTNQGLINVFA